MHVIIPKKEKKTHEPALLHNYNGRNFKKKKSNKVNVFILTLNGRRHYWQKRYVKAFDVFSRRYILNSSPFMAVLKTDDVDI